MLSLRSPQLVPPLLEAVVVAMERYGGLQQHPHLLEDLLLFLVQPPEGLVHCTSDPAVPAMATQVEAEHWS